MRFRTRAALSFVATGLLVLAVSFVGYRAEFRETLVRAENPHLKRFAHRAARRWMSGRTIDRPQPVAHETALGCAVFSTTGELLVQRDGEAPPVDVPAALVREAIDRDGRSLTEFVTARDGQVVRLAGLLVRAKPADAEGTVHPAAVAFAWRSLDGLRERADTELLEGVVKSFPWTLFVGIAAAWVVANSITRPLARMARESSGAARSPDAPRVAGSGSGDELDDLAAALNNAFGSLHGVAERHRRFAAGAAHELRSPLAAVYSRSDVALRRPRTPEEYREALEEVRDVARRAGAMLESLLKMARADDVATIRREPVELGPIVEQEVRDVVARAGLDAADVRAHIAPGVPRISGDPDLLRVLVRNLLRNATTHGRTAEGADVYLEPSRAGCVLRVADHGPGVPASHREIVFDPFSRVEADTAAAEGFGLGLALVQSIARAHGGGATLVAPRERGTEVVVTLASDPPTPARAG